MLERLTSPETAAAALGQIRELVVAHTEWFLTQADGTSYDLRRDEFDFALSQNRLTLSSWTDKGTRAWRIVAWEWNGEKLLLQSSRRMGAERAILELIPRASATAIAATVKAARQRRCDQLGQFVAALQPGTKVERAGLSPGMRRGQPGRNARIILCSRNERIAVTATVASTYRNDVDAFLSSALIWYTRASEKARPPYFQKLWLVLESDAVKPAMERIAFLRESLRRVISVYEIDEEWQELVERSLIERTSIWKQRLARFPPVSEPVSSEWASMIVAQAREAIDVVHARQGETLRYFGLPFARVRRVMGVDRVWFGTEGSRRRTLDDGAELEWTNLMNGLREHRSATAVDHRHALYRTAGEAWLESLLRRDITKLDPGLIIAPLHAQFRTARGGPLGVRPVDLLALRQDGRLVVIELKVSEDREHVLQGADYWRRVEAHRRRGHITRAKLFRDLPVKDEPPLVYLVGPTLRFHPSFSLLAHSIAPDIEIYRFDINEDWRSGVRVTRRTRVN